MTVVALLRMAMLSLVLAASSPAWGQGAQVTELDKRAVPFLAEGTKLIQAKQPAEAIPHFDKAIALYEGAYGSDGKQYYSARSQLEAMAYALEAAAANKGAAVVVAGHWGYAYYLKGYALLELQRLAEAKTVYLRAAALAPRNSQFLSELGHVYQTEKSWPLALQTFERAAAAAKEFTTETSRNKELARAWRGMGFAYTELKRFDDAEKIYRQCLELDANDAMAMHELRYLQSLKAKEKPQ